MYFLNSIVNYHEEIRSLAQAAGASIAVVFAPFGAYLTWKRTSALTKQNELTAHAHTYQADNDEKRRLYESYQLGVQELAHEHVFRRLGAIVILGDVAKNIQFTNPSYTAISGLIRSLSHESITTKNEILSEIEFKKNQKLDLVAAIEQIKNRKIDVPEFDLYKFSINLQFSFIPYSDLKTADLRFANLDNINLTGSNCLLAKFGSASIVNSELSNTNFRKANFKRANLSGSNFSNSNLTKASFFGADISGANFRGCKISKLMILKKLNCYNESLEHLNEINRVLPNSIIFGEFYHPIQLARWDSKNPPIVDVDIQYLIDEKTDFIQKEMEEIIELNG